MTFRTRWYNIVTAALFSVMTLGGALLLLIPDAILVYYLGVGLLVACLLWCTIRSARAGIVAHPTYLELRRTHRTRRFAWEHITGFGVGPGLERQRNAVVRRLDDHNGRRGVEGRGGARTARRQSASW